MRALMAQQQMVRTRTRVEGPWQWWTPETIALVSNTPLRAVQSDWPLVWAASTEYGISDYNTVRGILATIAIETAHTFKPVTEAFWLSDAWRWANLRYAPYWGRGYVQLTWESNYRYYGERVGHPEILTVPDLALVSGIAAPLLAAFFLDSGAADAAARADWYECRRRVQGAYAGIDEFIRIVDGLDATKIAA